MEIIILGVVLFVIGVGATIVYDNYKNKAAVALKVQQEQNIIRREEQAKFAAFFNTSNTSKKKSQEEVISELQRERNQHQNYQTNVRRTIKPGSIVAGPIKEGDMPTETQYVEELFNDVSINSTLTVQELIAKIEQMKKKL